MSPRFLGDRPLMQSVVNPLVCRSHIHCLLALIVKTRSKPSRIIISIDASEYLYSISILETIS